MSATVIVLFRRMMLVAAGVVLTLAIAGSAVASPPNVPPLFASEAADESMRGAADEIQAALPPGCNQFTVCVWPLPNYAGGGVPISQQRLYDCKWVETLQWNRSIYNHTKFPFALWRKTQFNRVYVGTAAPYKAYAKVPNFDIIQSPGCPYP